MNVQARQISSRPSNNYIPDPLDPRHPNNPNTPMDPDYRDNPGNPANPNHPDNADQPVDEIRDPGQPAPPYKFAAAKRDARFYEELMQLMDFGQNELYTRY